MSDWKKRGENKTTRTKKDASREKTHMVETTNKNQKGEHFIENTYQRKKMHENSLFWIHKLRRKYFTNSTNVECSVYARRGST